MALLNKDSEKKINDSSYSPLVSLNQISVGTTIADANTFKGKNYEDFRCGLHGTAKVITANTDLNTVTGNGWYDFTTYTNGPSFSEGSTGTKITLFVVCSGDANYCTQFAYPCHNNKNGGSSVFCATRRRFNGSWGGWRNLAAVDMNVLSATTAASCTGNSATATTATNVKGGTVSATSITSTTGKIESTGTSSSLPQILFHIPSVNYSRLRMSTDGVIHAQNGGNDNYVNMKAANFIGNLSGKATTAGKADVANWLNPNTTLQYGASGLNYFNSNLSAGTTANANVAPEGGWNHVIRMNHANGSGYFTDLATPFNTLSGFYWRQIRGGAVYGWYRICDSNNSTAFTSGSALGVRQAGNASSTVMKFHWSGQGGQPTWLWGGIDGTNMYVWNPSNFHVANANTVAELGVNGTVNNAANKIVRTQGNGYTMFGYINSNVGVENGNIANIIYDNGDGFFRKCSLAHLINKINGAIPGGRIWIA